MRIHESPIAYSWAFIEVQDENHNRDHMALTRYGDQPYTWYEDDAFQTPMRPADYLKWWRARRSSVTRTAQGLMAHHDHAATARGPLPVMGYGSTFDVLDPAPAPTPTRVRRDTRPTATPVPGRPIISLEQPDPVTLPSRRGFIELPLTCRRHPEHIAAGARVNRCRIWLYDVGKPFVPKTPAPCGKIAYFKGRDTATITCRINDRWQEGPHLACPFIPDEPASAYPGLMGSCVTVDMRTR